MRSKYYIVSKAFTSNQLIDQLCVMLAEHKWNDALAIIPAVLINNSERPLFQFIWKAIHLIVIHMHIPQDDQIKILRLMLKSEIKSYPIILEWFTNVLQSTDHTCIENYFKLMKNDVVPKKVNKYPTALFDSYMSLFFYMQWIAKFNELTKMGTHGHLSEFGQSPEEKEHLDIGLVILDRLNKSYFYFGKCDIFEDQAINENSSSNSKDKKKHVMCEWLLAPLLDLEEKLNGSLEGHENLKKRYGAHRLSGLEIVEQYSGNHKDHLPSLKLHYLYISKFHPELKEKKLDILKSICLLSPEEYLVLTYVQILLQEEFSDLLAFTLETSSNDKIDISKTLKRMNSEQYSTKCHLSGKRSSSYKECIDILASFLEYSQWHKSIEAWKLLVTILKIMQNSWINCWNCKKCTKSRNFIKKHCAKLALWPEIFWNFSNVSNLLTEVEGKLLLYRAYAAFVFGYDDDIKTTIKLIFKNQMEPQLPKEFTKLFKLKGPFSDIFLSYLQEEKNNRFQNTDFYFTQTPSDKNLKRSKKNMAGDTPNKKIKI